MDRGLAEVRGHTDSGRIHQHVALLKQLPDGGLVEGNEFRAFSDPAVDVFDQGGADLIECIDDIQFFCALIRQGRAQSPGGASRPEDKKGIPAEIHARLFRQSPRKTDSVGVVSFQLAVPDGDDIDGSDFFSQLIQLVQIFHDRDLVGFGDIESGEIHASDSFDNRLQFVVFDLCREVEIIHIQFLKGFVEHLGSEGLLQRISQ